MTAIPLLFLAKAHVKQYTRRDGTVVKEHDDKRQGARPGQLAMPHMGQAPVAGPGRQAAAMPPSGQPPAPDGQGPAPGATQGQGQNPTPGQAPGQPAPAQYGVHNVKPGDRMRFQAGAFQGQGEVVSAGEDGAKIKDAAGREHGVHWHEMQGRHEEGGQAAWQGGTDPQNQSQGQGQGQGQPSAKPEASAGQPQPVQGELFKAADFAKQHDQADVTPEAILAQFPPEVKQKIEETEERLKGVVPTDKRFKKDGQWAPERQKIHQKIRDTILSDEAVKRATPPPGQAPTFILLGGRGGSGKSSFAGQVYDPQSFIVLDADHIKGMLDGYEGWNAAEVHEESGEVFDHLVEKARSMNLNVVLDKTMKTAKSAIKDVNDFKAAGYRTEAHYMHLPRQEAAKRAVGRFIHGGETGRYVPVDVVLSNTTNEGAFDQVRDMVDAWSFRDNNVAKGESPKMISQSDEPPIYAKLSGQESGETKADTMMKALGHARMLLWRIK